MPANNSLNLNVMTATNAGILEPNERLKLLSSYSNALEIDPNVPPRRYYRSGLEMVRMANVYMEEGNFENAYVLYLKFMTLFIEKIRDHPEYGTVPISEKATNSNKLREVLPKAEKLKKVLLQKYTIEHTKFLNEQKEARKRIKEKPPPSVSDYGQKDKKWPSVVPGPTIGEINYPDDDQKSINVCEPLPPPEQFSEKNKRLEKFEDLRPTPTPTAVDLKLPLKPSVDRSLKPASLLSPSAQKPGNRDIVIPSKLPGMFLSAAQSNTFNNVETCGVLAGKLEHDQLIITHVIISKQEGTSDTCTTSNEEEIFDYQDQHNLITLGWIHTHPTQTAFLSSIDVHTQCSYQIMMPEAIAIVCAPKYQETGIFVLTSHGLSLISECRQTGFHAHPRDPPIFIVADHTKLCHSTPLKMVDLR